MRSSPGLGALTRFLFCFGPFSVIRVPCRRAVLNRCMRSTGYAITWKSTRRRPSPSKRCTTNTSGWRERNKQKMYFVLMRSDVKTICFCSGAIVTILATIHWVQQTLGRSWRMSFPTWRPVVWAWGENPNILAMKSVCSSTEWMFIYCRCSVSDCVKLMAIIIRILLFRFLTVISTLQKHKISPNIFDLVCVANILLHLKKLATYQQVQY